MISALIHNENNTLLLELPTEFVSFQMKLLSIGIRQRPQDIRITDNDDDAVRVKLFSESDIGNHLTQVFSESDTLTC